MDERVTLLRGAGLELRLDADGTVVSASATGTSATPGGPVRWLSGAGSLHLEGSAGPLVLGAPRVRVDDDEVEVERSGGGLRTVVRHGVEQDWVVRLVLANETDAPLTLTRVHLGWSAAPGAVVTALAAGAEAAYAVQPADGTGPLLVGRLRSGAQAGVDATGFVLAPPVLGPGHRWAVQWRFEVVAEPRSAPAGDLPATTWLDLEQPVVLPAGPDVAVVADGLATGVVGEDRVEVEAVEPGTYTVELRSARGTTAYGLSWAPGLDDLLDDAAAALLAGPATPGGTARLAGPEAGLVVQDALARRVLDAEPAADALELLAGRLAEQVDDDPGAGGPATVALLAREADRTGDAALLGAAAAGLLALDRAAPGTGLAGTAVVLGHVRSGRPADALLAHLGALRAASSAQAPAGLELTLLLRPRSSQAPLDADLVRALRRLGTVLGAGLPGRVVPAVPVDRVAHAGVLLGLVDEATGQRLRLSWGVTAAELAGRCAAQARARAADPAEPGVDRALAWLVLGRPPG